MADTGTTLEIERGVATLTLDRPEQRNALSVDLLDSVGEHLAAATADTAVRVVVLTNAGSVFCAGADLKATGDEEPRHTLVDVLEAIITCPKPVIGRIAGHCMGGGVGLAAACDISVIDEEAKVGFTEVRLGVAPAIISVVCLPKMRRADASELFLSGERIPAPRAVEVGLLNRAVPADRLDAAVSEVVDKVIAGGPRALEASKRLIREIPGKDPTEAFAWTGELSAELFGSDEASAGIRAWSEKVDAPWIP